MEVRTRPVQPEFFFCPQNKRYFVIFPTADCRIITEALLDLNYTNTRCWLIQLNVVSSCYSWLAQVNGIHCDTIRQLGTVSYSHSIANYDHILYHFRDKSRFVFSYPLYCPLGAAATRVLT